jgi:hypothetical protein
VLITRSSRTKYSKWILWAVVEVSSLISTGHRAHVIDTPVHGLAVDRRKCVFMGYTGLQENLGRSRIIEGRHIAYVMYICTLE